MVFPRDGASFLYLNGGKLVKRGREVKYWSSGNLYPNGGKSVKRVEILTSAGRVSLPK